MHRVRPPVLRWVQALTYALAIVLGGCSSGKPDDELSQISKTSLSEQDIRKYLDTYVALKEHKQKTLQAGDTNLSTAELNNEIILRHGISLNEFTFFGARIDNALALLDREQTTPIPEAYRRDCELVRRMRKEIEEARKPVPFPELRKEDGSGGEKVPVGRGSGKR